jgi:leucyl-tRNA synthetase
MFIGAFDLSASWSTEGVRGCRRFLDRVWKLQDMLVDGDGYRPEMETKIHQTIKKVSNDFEALKFNTAIAAMMGLVNDFYKANSITKGEYATLILLLNPVAPHMTEELWEMYYTGTGRAYQQKWPEYDEAKTVESTVEIAVQINGKVKAQLMVGLDEDDASVKEKAHAIPAIAGLMEGKNVVKEIYVKGRILNIVVK